MYVSTAMARALLGELERGGSSIDTLLQLVGLSPELIADPGGQLPVKEWAALIEAALDLTGDEGLGLRAGWHAPTGAAHVVGFVLVNSQTLRDAILLFRRYASLMMENARFGFVEAGDEARFGYVHEELDGPAARFESEMVLSFVLNRFGRHFLGSGASLRRARFTHPAPPWADLYEKVFDCPIDFECATNELVFDREYLDVPQLHSDAWVCQLLRERAEALLRERHSECHLPRRVKDLLKYHLGLGQLDADAVARELGFSPRTLRRRLSGTGHTLRELFDEAREELACSALRGSDRPIKDVAYALGFSEPSAFHRAFKRWTGQTPQQYREASGDEAPSVESRPTRAESLVMASI